MRIWGLPRRKKDDYYITFLKYVHRAIGEGRTVEYPDVWPHVQGIHPTVSEEAFQRAFLSATEPVVGEGHINLLDNLKCGNHMVLTLEAYFHLLEHEELEQARSSSTTALRVAIAAIVITGAFALASLILPMVSSTTVEVESAQIVDLKEFIESQVAP